MSEIEARFKTTGRNDDCPCGSGKKYKKCHLREDEEAVSKALGPVMEKSPRAAGAMLSALDMALSPSLHVVVVGEGAMAAALRKAWAPHRIFISLKAGEKSKLAFAENFEMKEGKPTAYICVDQACRLPSTDAGQAIQVLTEN